MAGVITSSLFSTFDLRRIVRDLTSRRVCIRELMRISFPTRKEARHPPRRSFVSRSRDQRRVRHAQRLDVVGKRRPVPGTYEY